VDALTVALQQSANWEQLVGKRNVGRAGSALGPIPVLMDGRARDFAKCRVLLAQGRVGTW